MLIQRVMLFLIILIFYIPTYLLLVGKLVVKKILFCYYALFQLNHLILELFV